MLNSRIGKNKKGGFLYGKIFISVAVILFGFILSPTLAKAATVYFSPNSDNISQDDVFIVEARISSPEEAINVAEGTIKFDNNKL